MVTNVNHQFQVTLTGQPDLPDIVLASTKLTLNASAWKPMSTNTADGNNGVFKFPDTNATHLN